MFKINHNQLTGFEAETVAKNNFYFDQVSALKTDKVFDDGKYLSHLSNCILSIEPIQLDDPIYLFGSKSKVLTTNKVSIFKSNIDKSLICSVNNSVKGDLLAEFFISDEELSLALINHNSESFHTTITNLYGKNINTNSVLKTISSLEKRESELYSYSDDYRDQIRNSIAIVKTELLKKQVSKKKVKDACVRLNSCIDNIFSLGNYSLSVLESDLVKDINSFFFEFESTISKLMTYKNNSILSLDNSSVDDDDDNYLVSYLNGLFNTKEKHVLSNVCKSIIPFIEKDKINGVENFITKLLNTKQREIAPLSNGTISMHTFLSNSRESSCKKIEMRLGVASINNSCDYLSTAKEFMRISFSINDLLLLLRSSKDSIVFGTIEQFAGQTIPFVKIKNTELDAFNEQKVSSSKNDMLHSKFKTSINKIQCLIEKEKFLSSEKQSCLKELDAFEFNIYSSIDSELSNSLKQNSLLNDQIKDSMGVKLKDKSKNVNDTVLAKSLLILK